MFSNLLLHLLQWLQSRGEIGDEERWNISRWTGRRHQIKTVRLQVDGALARFITFQQMLSDGFFSSSSFVVYSFYMRTIDEAAVCVIPSVPAIFPLKKKKRRSAIQMRAKVYALLYEYYLYTQLRGAECCSPACFSLWKREVKGKERVKKMEIFFSLASFASTCLVLFIENWREEMRRWREQVNFPFFFVSSAHRFFFSLNVFELVTNQKAYTRTKEEVIIDSRPALHAALLICHNCKNHGD